MVDLRMVRDAKGRLDPVVHDPNTNLWYFWDETWSDLQGPYITEVEARAKMAEYCEIILGPGANTDENYYK